MVDNGADKDVIISPTVLAECGYYLVRVVNKVTGSLTSTDNVIGVNVLGVS